LLESIAATIARLRERLPVAVRDRLRALVGERLEEEREIDAAYSQLAADVAGRSKAAVARADVRGVERAMIGIEKHDVKLGRKRPDRVAAILATVQADLDAARRLRLARDQWAVKAVTYKSYQRSVQAPMDELSLMARGLDDIKRLAGPTAPVLERLTRRAASALRGLGVVVPPTDLAAVHALMVSAAQLAAQAVAVRRDAVTSGAMDRAWQASSAAAGALMLLDRARKDLDSALVPPVL
jgi:predicted regulator of Ras-like GTPase activity (Roadblock/LC7/MglB family)